MRWGLPDVPLAFVVSSIVASLVALPWVEAKADGGVSIPAAGLVVSLYAQNAVLVLWLLVLPRWKGGAGLQGAFGLRVRLTDGWWYVAGLGLAWATGLVLWPLGELAGGDNQQGVADAFEKAHGATFVLFAVGVVALAPLGEELLFRGLLLRSLQRRVSPTWAVLLGGLVFALVHAVGDPSKGTLVAFPALVALGVVNGVLAARGGDLSRSILVHAGFNTWAVVGILSSR